MLRPGSIPITTYQAGLVQARAYRTLTQFLNHFLQDYDLRMQEWALLGLVNDKGGLSQRALSDLLSVEAPLTTRMVTKLEHQGRIRRVQDSHDNRAKSICLTDDGSALVEEIEAKLRHELRRFLHGISLRQLTTYLAVLQKISERLPEKVVTTH